MVSLQHPVARRLTFPVAMWLLSRLVIMVAMLLIAPALAAPTGGHVPAMDWSVFSASDSHWYEKIARNGYEYIYETGAFPKQHSIAFFPLFPLLIRAVMTLGLPFEVAGTLVNNLAFLLALVILYEWVEDHDDANAARWVTATLAWYPLSLFGTVIYTEGLFLLLTTAALRAFDKQQYVWAALWGACATATRVNGLALIPAFLFVAWLERRPISAYVATLATAAGISLFSLYCWIDFGDFLAFLDAQRAWRASLGFNWKSWLIVLMPSWVGTPQDSLLFGLLCGCAYLLWRLRKRLRSITLSWGCCILLLWLWLMGGDSLMLNVIPWASIYLLWHLRYQLPLIAVIYGFCGLSLILASGSAMSASRFAYGIVTLSFALGTLLARYPRWGYPTMGLFAIILVRLAIQFAQGLWVA